MLMIHREADHFWSADLLDGTIVADNVTDILVEISSRPSLRHQAIVVQQGRKRAIFADVMHAFEDVRS